MIRTPALALQLFALVALALIPASPVLAQWQENGFPVCVAAGNQSKPVVVADGLGGAYIIWEDARGADAQIYAQHLGASGVPLWGANGMLVSSGFYPQYGPVAVGDLAGGVIVAWILSIVPEAAEGRGQRLNAVGSPLWGVGGIPVTPGAAFPSQLAIISDSRLTALEPAGAILGWADRRGGITKDVYVGAVDGYGVQRWSSAVCTAAGDQVDVRMVSDGSAPFAFLPKGAILTWTDYRASLSDPDVYAQRVSNAGLTQWAADGAAVAVGSGDARDPVIVPAGSQNAIIAWLGPAGGRQFGGYADRVGTLGSWSGGVPVTSPNGSQSQQAARSDGAGGIIVAGSQLALPLGRVVYVQRINSAGAHQWGDVGARVSTLASSQSTPMVVGGRFGGTIVLWSDNRGDQRSDLYAQLLDANGARSWGPDGVPVCIAPEYQLELAAAPDSTGGAIAAWTDYRNGETDIYAQRVTGWGGVVDASPGPRLSLALSAPRPNPSRAGVTLALELPAAASVSAAVFDARGRAVRTLVAAEALAAGPHSLAWNGDDDRGARAPSGVYWISVRAAGEARSVRAVLLP